MVLGLSFGKSKSKSSSTTNSSTSGSNTFTGQSRPVTPEGWTANYNALGKSLGFGAVTNPPRPAPQAVSATPAQSFLTPDGTFNPQEFQPSYSWIPPSQKPQNQPAQPTGPEQFTGSDGGPTGYNAQQQTALGILENRAAPGGNPAVTALQTGAGRANQGARALEWLWNDQINPALQSPASQLGAGTEDVGDISAVEGWRGRDNYLNPFLNEVVSATDADLIEQQDRIYNRNKMAAATGGAFGGRGEAVRQAISDDDFTRSRGSILGGLRSQGWKDSNIFSMQDADRSLSAAQANQSTRSANADRRQQRDMANLQAKLTTEQGKRDLMQLSANNAIEAANLGISEAELGVAASDQERQGAMDLFEAGQIGFEQLMAFLGLGTGLFGEEESGAGTETATGTSTEKGTASGTKIGGSFGK